MSNSAQSISCASTLSIFRASTQFISYASTYSESNETLEGFVNSLKLNVTNQAQNLEDEAPSLIDNMDNSGMVLASSSCILLTTLQNSNFNYKTQNRDSDNTNELSGKSIKPQNSSRTLCSNSGVIKPAKVLNTEDYVVPTRGWSPKALNKKKTNGMT
ncbi:11568_t:CDS:2 [Scutellospora calospora]|uniref:11568_t:CDS:1 n=1 Tax=Scutellospora calospora TaxID=85575 RepID=A0ACA9K2I2_9GLOM|nr:11568_t:CDS:2 [Scutellospora calospora]